MFYSDHSVDIYKALWYRLMFYTDHNVDIYEALGEHSDVLF